MRKPIVLASILMLAAVGCTSWSTVSTLDNGFTVHGPFVVVDEPLAARTVERNIGSLQDARGYVVVQTRVVVDQRSVADRETREIDWYGLPARRLDHAHFVPPPMLVLDEHLGFLASAQEPVWVERFDLIEVHPVATQRDAERITARYGVIGGMVNSILGGLRGAFRRSNQETGETDVGEDYYVCDMRLRLRDEAFDLRRTRHFLAPGESVDLFRDERGRFQMRALVQTCIADAVGEVSVREQIRGKAGAARTETARVAPTT